MAVEADGLTGFGGDGVAAVGGRQFFDNASGGF